MNKGMLCSMTGMSSSIMAKMTNQEMVSLEVLEWICAVLDCNIGDAKRNRMVEIQSESRNRFQMGSESLYVGKNV